MALTPGAHLGPFVILSALGAGGMGEVYRARDRNLGRDVALKILPDAFRTDPDRLARFQREAKTLASLNHPNIAGIYGIEEANGVTALVMELVEGEDLARRIARGAIPVDEALPITRQIAEALEAAHEQGIIHRDVKPANIKVRSDGTVKVLDFGLAKAMDPPASSPNGSQSPTITSPVMGTRVGRILGTAAYMSPEQARGLPADRRADVWAFGVVVYEMLTGRPAFQGETISDVLAKVIEREPDWTALPAATPPRLRELLRRCGRKDPKTRLQAIGDARIQIEELTSGATEETATAGATPSRAPRRARVAWIVAALSLTIIAALAVAAMLYLRRVVPEPLPTRFEIPTPPTSDPVSFALSADGRQLAFVAMAEGAPRLWVRPLDQVTAQPLAGTDGASYPFWAPDGRAVGFFADGKLKRIDLGSGGPQVLADAPGGRGGTWNRDGVIVFGTAGRGGVMRVPATGGTPVAVFAPGQPNHRWPQFLPDGRHFLFLGGDGTPDTMAVHVGALDGSEPTRVLAAESGAMYAPSGALLWVRQGVLFAQRFDPARAAVSGEPIRIAQGVGIDKGAYRAAFAVSSTGVLAHRAVGGERRQLTWIDQGGNPRGTVGPPDDNALSTPELAPNGRRVAVFRTVEMNTDVYLIDIGRHVPSRLTFDASLETLPLWSPDGLRVAFSTLRNGVNQLFEKMASGAGGEQPLVVTGEPKTPLAWSPDGRFLLYAIEHPGTGADLWALPMDGDRKPFPVMQTPFDETAGQFSPDGEWLAYEWNESNVAQIYVRPFQRPGGTWQVSTAGGSQPRWRPDGKELFYIAPDASLMAAPIAVGADRQTLEVSAARPLFRTRLASGANIPVGRQARPQYAVASDGRFLMNMAAEGAAAPPITVILNWDAALKK